MRSSHRSLRVAILAALSGGVIGSAHADGAVWITPVEGGELRFYDWGYSGPQGQTATEFAFDGFDGAAQIQHVVTTGPDGLTPDDPNLIREDLNNSTFFWESNMDSRVNFYDWGYTTVAGSTFNNMQIDADGDYHIARNDMAFNWYGSFDYDYTGTGNPEDIYPGTPIAGVPEGVYDTNIGFQPYALSDATGWCGSIMATNPSALEAMAGQVTFDFGFEAFLPTTPKNPDGSYTPGTGSMQIVSDFVMRSYGSLEVDAGGRLFKADAVVNNTSPIDSPVELDASGNPVMVEVPVLNADGTPALDASGNPRTMMVEKKTVGGGGVDESYYNTVSFMGGGVVPELVWVLVGDLVTSSGNPRMSNENIIAVLDVDADGNPIIPIDPETGEPMTGNLVHHRNSFAGYPFLLRADGVRIVDALNFDLYPDFSGVPAAGFNAAGELINLEGNVIANLAAVPIPGAVWLFGSGLLGLLGMSSRGKTSRIKHLN